MFNNYFLTSSHRCVVPDIVFPLIRIDLRPFLYLLFSSWQYHTMFSGDSFFFFCSFRFYLINFYSSASLSKKNFHEGPESEMHILFTRLCFFFFINSRRRNLLCVWFLRLPFLWCVCSLSFDYFLYKNCVSRFVERGRQNTVNLYCTLWNYGFR